MKCPNCDVALVLADRQGIEIDYCPQCRGVWLDRGELDKIIERSAVAETRKKRDYDDDDYDDFRKRPSHDSGKYPEDDYSRRHKKKSSILGELFDF